MFAALRILLDVIRFRLRMFEMANLAGALTIMLALRLPASEVAVRTGFGLLLNLLAYLINDYHDVEIDLDAPGKDREKTRYLRDHMRQALAVQWVLGGLLLVVGFLWATGLALTVLAAVGAVWLYTARLKGVPLLDIVACGVWGGAMSLVGVPFDSAVGWLLAGQLALFSAVFEAIQVVRDRSEDLALGIRSTAVALGEEPTILLARGLTLVTAAYGALALHPGAGLAMALAALLPYASGAAGRFWNLTRLVFGPAWLFACYWVYVHGSTFGILLR